MLDVSSGPPRSHLSARRYKSMSHWREEVRKCFPDKSDQNYPPFVIVDESGSPVGKVHARLFVTIVGP